MPEITTITSGLIRLLPATAKACWQFINRNNRKIDGTKIVKARERFKKEFSEKIHERFLQELREDVVIRDIRRVNLYPDTPKHKGISPWFKVGLLETYHGGIQVGLRWYELIFDKHLNSWREVDYSEDETGEKKLILIGFIPFEQIEMVDWEGDEYYYLPQIYCYFDTKRREPYESLAYCEKRESEGGRPYYVKFAEYDAIKKATRKYFFYKKLSKLRLKIIP
jgi:hypothetical protein